jgi:hypothetical protein
VRLVKQRIAARSNGVGRGGTLLKMARRSSRNSFSSSLKKSASLETSNTSRESVRCVAKIGTSGELILGGREN